MLTSINNVIFGIFVSIRVSHITYKGDYIPICKVGILIYFPPMMSVYNHVLLDKVSKRLSALSKFVIKWRLILYTYLGYIKIAIPFV